MSQTENIPSTEVKYFADKARDKAENFLKKCYYLEVNFQETTDTKDLENNIKFLKFSKKCISNHPQEKKRKGMK